MKSMLIILSFFLSTIGFSQSNAKNNSSKNSLEIRDPFKRKRFKRRSLQVRKFGGTTFNNLPSIEGVSLDQIQIIGILLGESRRAMAKILNGSGELSKETYTLKEGMKLGLNNAEIKAILPGGIVLVEKIRNVYDEDEYLETILPVSLN